MFQSLRGICVIDANINEVVKDILFTGRFQPYAILHVVIFLSYIIGDLIAIPFSYVFSENDGIYT
jgi:hypothetical protein